MNARNITIAAGIGLLYLMLGALLLQQYRAPATLTKPDLTAAVQSAIQPLNQEMAKLSNNVSQLAGKIEPEKNAEILAAVQKTVDDTLSKRIDPAMLVTKTDLEAESNILKDLIRNNTGNVAAILRGEKSDEVFGNVQINSRIGQEVRRMADDTARKTAVVAAQETAVLTARKTAAMNGNLRVFNRVGQPQRLRIGSVMFAVPVGASSRVVPAGTVISSLNGRKWEMPEEGGLTIEFFGNSVHRLNGT